MGRRYAGILGPLAMATVLLRGVIRGADAEPTLQFAIASLVVFALIGAMVGRLAEAIVLESVKRRFDNEFRTRDEDKLSPSASSPAT